MWFLTLSSWSWRAWQRGGKKFRAMWAGLCVKMGFSLRVLLGSRFVFSICCCCCLLCCFLRIYSLRVRVGRLCKYLSGCLFKITALVLWQSCSVPAHISFSPGHGNPLEKPLLTAWLTPAEAAFCPQSHTGGCRFLSYLTRRGAESSVLSVKLLYRNDNKTVSALATWTCKCHTKH